MTNERDPLRSFRAPDELWDPALVAARELGTDVSKELRKTLAALIKKARRRQAAGTN